MEHYKIVFVIAIFSILISVDSKPHSILNLNELSRFTGYHYTKIGDHIMDKLSEVQNRLVGKAQGMHQFLSGENQGPNNFGTRHRPHTGPDHHHPINQPPYGRPPFGRPPFNPFQHHPHHNQNPCQYNQALTQQNPFCSQTNPMYPQPNPNYPQGNPQTNPNYPEQNPFYPQNNQNYPQLNPFYPQQNPNYPQPNPMQTQPNPIQTQPNPMQTQPNPIIQPISQEYPNNNNENTPTASNTNINNNNNGGLISGIVQDPNDPNNQANHGNESGHNNIIFINEMDKVELKDPLSSTTINPIYDIDIRFGA